MSTLHFINLCNRSILCSAIYKWSPYQLWAQLFGKCSMPALYNRPLFVIYSKTSLRPAKHIEAQRDLTATTIQILQPKEGMMLFSTPSLADCFLQIQIQREYIATKIT